MLRHNLVTQTEQGSVHRWERGTDLELWRKPKGPKSAREAENESENGERARKRRGIIEGRNLSTLYYIFPIKLWNVRLWLLFILPSPFSRRFVSSGEKDGTPNQGVPGT